ncbi:MAG: HEPN domain-containing protein [Actinomycetota bacterium]|nr:HEPN domain-containing protein [Actinomycetota bacterium]
MTLAYGPTEALLAETLGLRLLTYLCAVTSQEMERRLASGDILEPAAESVLTDHLVPLAQQVASHQTANPGTPTALALHPLGNFDAETGTSVGNALRMAAGGKLAEPLVGSSADRDQVKALLFRLARDSYPLLLAPLDEPWQVPHLSLFQHPTRAELDAALAKDAELSRLYQDEDPVLGRRGAMYNSLGRGGSIQSVMFGATVISAAWNAATMVSETPLLIDLLRTIDANVDIIREAVDDRQPPVRALLVFTGLMTDGGATVETPWGTLRPLNEIERRASPPLLEGAVSGTGQDGKSVTVSYGGELVLDSTLPYGLVVKSWKAMEKGFPDFPPVKGAGSLRRRLEGVQLAVLLAVERVAGSWATARPAWQWVADPLSQGRGLSWNDTRTPPGFMPYELTENDCHHIGEWTARIDRHWEPHVDIAVRRVLSAVHARTDPSDRLVDAVIAWENLFGTSEGEPRFRITSSMAWLLGADGASRVSLQDQLKRLYDARSKIVHGAKFEDQAMVERGNEGLVLALRSLEVLIRDRPDVLALADGAARSLRLILDA